MRTRPEGLGWPGARKRPLQGPERRYNPRLEPLPEAWLWGSQVPRTRKQHPRGRLQISAEVAYVSFGLDGNRVGSSHRCPGYPADLPQYPDDARGRSVVPGRYQVRDGTGTGRTDVQGEQD